MQLYVILSIAQHKSLADGKFKCGIYVQLVLSFYRTGLYDKCSYFAVKFLRQIVNHYEEHATASRQQHIEFVAQLLTVLRE
jgi:hypothetical protein